MTHSKNKGKRGELELCSVFKSEGFEARRGQQYQGGEDSPDIVVEGLPWLHVECKRTEKLALYDAIDQARRDAAEMQIPIVAHRRSRHRWVAILDLRDFLRLARETTIE